MVNFILKVCVAAMLVYISDYLKTPLSFFCIFFSNFEITAVIKKLDFSETQNLKSVILEQYLKKNTNQSVEILLLYF